MACTATPAGHRLPSRVKLGAAKRGPSDFKSGVVAADDKLSLAGNAVECGVRKLLLFMYCGRRAVTGPGRTVDFQGHHGHDTTCCMRRGMRTLKPRSADVRGFWKPRDAVPDGLHGKACLVSWEKFM